jgi:hypothetical protein
MCTKRAGCYDESGIDEDHEDWEDVNEDAIKSTVDENKLFQRIKPGVNMTSYRSLISLGLASKQLQSLTPRTNKMAFQSTLLIHKVEMITLTSFQRQLPWMILISCL